MANDIDKKKEDEYVRQTGSLKERLGRVKKTRWWRFSIVALIYVLWTLWMGNPWLLLGLLLLADIYLTQFIPWGAWKGWKPGPLRTLMSWIDAIVYALVLVYFLFWDKNPWQVFLVMAPAIVIALLSTHIANPNKMVEKTGKDNN
jgi:hypothetical protein